MQRKLVILLGAGASIPAKMPSTAEITNLVLSGDSVWHHSNGTYYVDSKPRGETDEYVQAVTAFIAHIKSVIDAYYAANARLATYEDIYYVVSQVDDSETGEYDNPAIHPLVQKINAATNGLRLPTPYEKSDGWRMIELAGEAVNYIRDIVWYSLSKRPHSLDYLKFLSDCIQSDACEWIDLFTLNHDTIIEQFFASNGVAVVDGFGLPLNNVRYWSPELYGNHTPKSLRLFKPHGSTNWFRFDYAPNVSLGIPLDGDPWHTKNPSGELRWPINGRPEMLVGRFNKMLEYTRPVYVDLQTQFHRSLREADRMLISGYSFGDKAINTRIIEWINDASDRRIVLIHANLLSLRSSARPAVSSQLDRWISQKRLLVIVTGIEATQWSDVRNSLNE